MPLLFDAVVLTQVADLSHNLDGFRKASEKLQKSLTGFAGRFHGSVFMALAALHNHINRTLRRTTSDSDFSTTGLSIGGLLCHLIMCS